MEENDTGFGIIRYTKMIPKQAFLGVAKRFTIPLRPTLPMPRNQHKHRINTGKS
jgi:hypothetical protein